MLRVMFIILFLVSIACTVRGVVDKRRNIGYVLMSAMISIGDIFYVILLGVGDAKAASKVLLPYYILHAWLLFAFMLMIILIERYKKTALFLIAPALLCIYQTYLVISHSFGARIFTFQKRMTFRKAFWVAADDSKNTGFLFSFRSYRIATYLNMFLILCLLIVCILYSHKIFKMRYTALIIMILAYMIAEGLTVHFAAPVWIPGVAYNLLSVLCLYFTGKFARDSLKDWSLDRFANDMSDGLILFDKYDDLIHLNDMVKNTLEKSLLDDFRDKSKLEEWIEESYDQENREIVAYAGTDREYYFKVKVQELGGNEKRIGTLYILHDTTDSMMQIKAMKRANDELERASQMKSDFLANMSHEIRTPMNAVIGMAEIAMREKDPQMITDYLLQIQSSGRNLVNIINDILDYSKIESGKMEIIEEDFTPATELADIANVLSTRIGDKPLELFVIVETGLPHVLHADVMRIRQVLINLANNAIKFTKEGMVRIHVTCESDGPDVVNTTFHVIDTGIGIKEEDMDKLFVSFQQVDSKRNRSVEGTGLGLAISQKLVEAMHGQIGVESEYGKGSDFWFTVPQKVIDDTNDIVVEHASEKCAYVLAHRDIMADVFMKETGNLGVEGVRLRSIKEYSASGKKDYVFFEENDYDSSMQEFLESHKDVMGIVLIDIASKFESDRPNLHVMRRPEITTTMVNFLSDRFQQKQHSESEKYFRPNFTAPEARILVVDDNPINLTIAGGLMAPLSVQLDTAGGGQEAVDKVKSNAYDMVFMDHMMPEIDGVDATRMIRSAGEKIHQPVIIALSANVMEDARILFKEAGMDDFVGKPVDIKILTTAIKKWLSPEKIIEHDISEMDTENDQSENEVVLQIEGLDLETAVRALGSPMLYNKIAEEYYRTGEDRLQGIKEAYGKQDWTDYTIKVHALKSSSRQIGAMKLGDMAETLEKAGKAGNIDKILSDTDVTVQVFQSLLDEMAAYYPDEEEDESDKPMIDRETLNGFLDELATCCEDLELDGMEEIGNRMKQYAYEESMQDQIKALYKAIADIDMDACEEIISQLKGGL